MVEQLKKQGKIPDEELVESGYFSFIDGGALTGDGPKGADSDEPLPKDFVINDDNIVIGGQCVGFDCVNGESFGFDTLRLKENNLRIKFDDTSNSASFPRNDWQITANDSNNGGAERFSIEDITGGRVPFTIRAGAPSNSLYVDAQGDLGLGTSTPVLELHIVDGDTPTVRLEQDGSGGWTPQTWDLAGNETNFFLRDVTNGSSLPFRVRPGAPQNSIFVDTDGDVGLGTSSPSSKLDIIGDLEVNAIKHDSTNDLTLQNEFGTSSRINLITKGNLTFQIDSDDNQTDRQFTWAHHGTGCCDGSLLMTLKEDGQLNVFGGISVSGTTLNVPDYVFEENYELMPIDEVEGFIEANGHLLNVPSAEEIQEKGVNVTEFQMKLLEKIEELTLYVVSQEKKIDDLQAEIENLKSAE